MRRSSTRNHETGGSLPKWQGDLEHRAALRRAGHRDPPVVKNDDLLHQSEAQAGAGTLHREERLEHPIAKSVGYTRSVVAHADAERFRGAIDLRLDGDARRSAGGGARLDRVSQQV